MHAVVRFVLAVLMLMGVSGAALHAPTTAQAATKLTVDQFVAAHKGQYIDVDGYPEYQPYQCTDLFNLFHREVMGGSYVVMDITGGAQDLWSSTNTQLSNLYTKVSATSTAKKGDVAVWSGAKAGSGGYGHVSVVMADKGSYLSTFTQNPGYADIRDDSKTHLLGYLRPKSLPGAAPSVRDRSMSSDINGDGKADVIYFHKDGRWLVSYGATGRWTKVNTGGIDPARTHLADINNDKKADVVYFHKDGRWLVSYGATGRWTKVNTGGIDPVRVKLG